MARGGVSINKAAAKKAAPKKRVVRKVVKKKAPVSDAAARNQNNNDPKQDHLSMRLKGAAQTGIPLSEFWDFIPLRCVMCRKEKDPSEVYITSGYAVACIDKRLCKSK